MGGSLQQPAPSLVGKLFAGRYRIRERLGWTSYGQLFATRHERLGDTRLSLCVVPRQLSTAEELRFRSVMRAASRIDHPVICTIVDSGICEEGWPYVVSEQLDGVSLADELRRLMIAGDVLGAEHALTLLTQIAAALRAAHDADVLHLDLRPQSVLLCEAAGGVKLLGLGMAQALGASFQTRRLDAAERRISYTSPELRLGAPVDQRADIYSFGVLAFEILSGRPAAIDRELSAVAEGGLRQTHTGLNRPRNTLAGLEGVVLRCLEADLSHRVASADELLEALCRVARAHQRQDRRDPGQQPRAIAKPGSTQQVTAATKPLTHAGPPLLEQPLTASATERSDALEELVLALRDRDLAPQETVLDLVGLLEAEDEVLRLEGELEQLTELVEQLTDRTQQRKARLQRALLAIDHERERIQRQPRAARTLPSIDRLLLEQLDGRADQVARFLTFVDRRTTGQLAALRQQLNSRQLRLLRRAGFAADRREKLVAMLRSIKPRPLASNDPDLAARFATAEV